MVAPHFIGQLWQLIKRVRTCSWVSFHFCSISCVQKSLRRVRELPQVKLVVCHSSSTMAISCGEPSPCRIGGTFLIGFSPRNLMYLSTSSHNSMYLTGSATLMSLVRSEERR